MEVILMASVALRNVYKEYDGGVVAVKDFTLDIEDKEFIILVGPSGCGKSTTLRMIAGLEEITSGELYIDDVLMNDVQPKDRDIAMVFQNYALYPHMSVFDNMAFGLKLRKTPKDEITRRVNEAAKILEIEHLLDRKPAALSGGQRQRVALGRAIVRNPKVFLMDEPLSNLDAKLRVQMRVEITKLHQRLATTFIYVTHDQTEAMTMGSRIVVMNDGYIQQVADPTSLYRHPVNTFVAGFIGMPPMNFINSELTKDEKGISFLINNEKVYVDGTKYDVPELNEYVGKKVIVGIRPEAMSDDPGKVEESVANGSTVNVDVDVVERLGAQTYLYTRAGEISITASVDPIHSIAAVGDTVTIAIDNDRIVFFDPETENSIIS